MTLYKTIFQRSWHITRDHKLLWCFGFFALFLGGKGMDFEVLFTHIQLLVRMLRSVYAVNTKTIEWGTLMNTFMNPTMIGMFAVMLIAFFCAIIVIIVAQIGLVDAFGRYAKNRRKSLPPYSLQEAFSVSKNRFHTVLGVNIIGRGLMYVLLCLSIIPAALNVSGGFGYTIVLFILLMPVIILISFLTKYAVSFAVLKEQSVGVSFRNSWVLFRQNIGISLELAAIMFILYIAMNIFVIIAAVALSLPLGAFLVSTTAFDIANYIYISFLFVVIVLLAIISAMLFSTWHWGNWTLLFLELTKRPHRSKIHQLIRKTQ